MARAGPDLGAGYYRGLAVHHALWRPWLVHPELAPIFARIKANADRYATIPIAPRALALAQDACTLADGRRGVAAHGIRRQ